MTRLLVYCEGPTEESFVKAVLAPYLQCKGIGVTPIGANGASKYSVIKKELTRICKKDTQAAVTTMFDYYAFPKDAPGVSSAAGSVYDKAGSIESAI